MALTLAQAVNHAPSARMFTETLCTGCGPCLLPACDLRFRRRRGPLLDKQRAARHRQRVSTAAAHQPPPAQERPAAHRRTLGMTERLGCFCSPLADRFQAPWPAQRENSSEAALPSGDILAHAPSTHGSACPCRTCPAFSSLALSPIFSVV